MAILTVRDYFKHFEHSCINCPNGTCNDTSFRYEPQLLNSQERTTLANSIINLIHYNYTPLTTHPAFRYQIEYTKKIFVNLKDCKGWSETTPEFIANQNTFNDALGNSCATMIEWAKKECVPKLVEFFNSFAGKEYIPEHHRPPLLEFERLSELKNWKTSVRHEHFLTLAETLESYSISPRKPNVNQVGMLNPAKKSHEVQMFFEKHAARYPQFTYNVNSYPPKEFRRLCDVAKRMKTEAPEKEKFNTIYGVHDCWTYFGRVRKTTRTIDSKTSAKEAATPDEHDSNSSDGPPPLITIPRPMDLYCSPIALFFKKFNAPGYPDSTQTLPEDFKKLAEQECKRINFRHIAHTWARKMPDNALGYGRTLAFHRSEFHKELQDQFYQALEQQFEWFMEYECQRQGLAKEEYLVLFFELKESDLVALPDGKQRTAEQKRRAVCTVSRIS